LAQAKPARPCFGALRLRAALAQMDRDKANLGIVTARATAELTSAA